MTKLCDAIAPAVERTLGKGEVACSNHAGSTIFLRQTALKHASTSVLFLVNKPACLSKNAVTRWSLARLSNTATKAKVEAGVHSFQRVRSNLAGTISHKPSFSSYCH